MVGPAKRGSDRNRLRPGAAMIVRSYEFARPVGTVEPDSEDCSIIGHLHLWVRLPNLHRRDQLVGVPSPAAIRRTTDENTGDMRVEARRHLVDVTGIAIRSYEWLPVILPAPDAFRIPPGRGGGYAWILLHIGLRGEVA